MATLPLLRIDEVLHHVVPAVVISTKVAPTMGRLASDLGQDPTRLFAGRMIATGGFFHI
jgi:hypothetical protein